MKAAIYLRISDDREGKGLGVARQERDCRALCERSGWTVADVLADNDRSAYSGRRRPAYEQLLDGLKAGSWEVVVAWHPDRLHRSPRELETFIDVIEAASARVATVEAGSYDLSTPTGRMTARVVGAVARHESEHKAARQRAKHAELARAGRAAGGGKAFGFEPDRLTVREFEAAMIRRAAQATLDGASLRSIVAEWNAAGVPSTHGVLWTSTVVRRLLTSARIAGFREYEGRTYPAEWSAIVDHSTLVRLRAVLLDPGRLTRHHVSAYLLTGGVAVCGLCGTNLVARPRSGGGRCYVCAGGPNFYGCGKIRRVADDLERDVVERLLGYLHRVPAVVVDERPDVAPLVAEVTRLEDAMATLAEDYYVAGVVTRDQFLATTDAHRTALKIAQEALAAVDRPARPRDRRGDLQALLDEELVFDRRRAIVVSWVEQVTVNPAVRGRNRYDRSRVDVTWR